MNKEEFKRDLDQLVNDGADLEQLVKFGEELEKKMLETRLVLEMQYAG